MYDCSYEFSFLIILPLKSILISIERRAATNVNFIGLLQNYSVLTSSIFLFTGVRFDEEERIANLRTFAFCCIVISAATCHLIPPYLNIRITNHEAETLPVFFGHRNCRNVGRSDRTRTIFRYLSHHLRKFSVFVYGWEGSG